MKKSDFNYELPEKLIAQTPLENRSASKLLVMDKITGGITHKTFEDIINYINTGDCLVLNNSRVIPARLIGTKKDSGGAIELVLLKDKGDDIWECLTKPGKKAKVSAVFVFGDELKAEVIEVLENGNRLMKFTYNGVFLEVLDRLGLMPLPHYIKETLSDKERYQTVYSKENGSAAAPTAGLHFTSELLSKLEEKGVSIAYVTLHVGLGTFRPVKAENINDHEMHSEYYELDDQNANIINNAKNKGGKIFAVGTTSSRTLETIASNGLVSKQSGFTDIFIYPPYKFKIVDNLITNFHLPESTLMMLISALSTRENVLNAYEKAIENEYRFFSFGDSMLII